MGRIFTFGCSFTQFSWPTWADIILYKNEGYNLGIGGSGNESMLYRILETDRKFKFTKDDKIIVMFSTPLRWDVPIDTCTGWGSVYGGDIYENYNEKLFTLNGLIFRSFYSVKMINNYLKNKELNYIFSSLDNLYDFSNVFEDDYYSISIESKKLIEDVSNEVKIELMDMKTYTLGDKEWNITKYYTDEVVNSEYHRRPLEHFNWVKDILMKKIDIDLKMTEKEIMIIEDYIDNKVKTSEDQTNMKYNLPEFFNNRIEDCNIYINNNF